MRRVCAAFGVTVLALACLAGAAEAANYKIIAPLKGKSRPDLPCCVGYNLFGPPSISGDFVVFTSRSGPADGIWSYQISTKKIRKLAGTETKIPGGKGKFTEFGFSTSAFPTTVGGETVAFYGWDKDRVFGLYTVGVRGGAVSLIASTRTRMPGGGSRIFKDLRHASTNGEIIAFYGLSPDNATGIFKAKVDGTGLKTVIDATDTLLDARTPNGPADDYFGLYSQPSVGKSDVTFYAGGLFDPVSGPNAVFREKGFADLSDNMTKLEGGGKAKHTRIFSASAAVGSSEIAIAADNPGTALYGLFKVKDLDFAAAYATTKTKIPGGSSLFFNFLGYGLDASGLAFTASYDQAGQLQQDVFFVDKPGGTIRRVARGADYYLPYVGDRSISQGRIVFTEGTNFADTFFLATPN
ncbi:hypothetical protein [Hansschlegelia zhihuaiae]|uniref:DUF3616 domain-containing protein n=1 Tax=Hansschlegelia zhihuaiae TaxID=405005 RepID=A0A4Q0MQP5_9HYPH|nr:hypothetical protein [Hansschlegelia zhihuaiae]RXF75456.1 hypothetical protein EK403_00945 [Hansschlegelia zhihuaiae]